MGALCLISDLRKFFTIEYASCGLVFLFLKFICLLNITPFYTFKIAGKYGFLSVFIMSKCWVLSSALPESVEMPIFFFYNGNKGIFFYS